MLGQDRSLFNSAYSFVLSVLNQIYVNLLPSICHVNLVIDLYQLVVEHGLYRGLIRQLLGGLVSLLETPRTSFVC